MREVGDLLKMRAVGNLPTDPARIDALAKERTQRLINRTGHLMADLSDAAISSNANLKQLDIEKLQVDIVGDITALLVAKGKLVGDAQEVSDKDIEDIIDKYAIGLPEPTGEFDESDETVLEAKTILLGGVAEEHYVWIDFDGAKRAAGHTYSKYAALVYEDIKFSADAAGLTIDQFNGVGDLYSKFRRNASLNHTVSSRLQDPTGLPPEVVIELERTLHLLKKERYGQLSQLVRWKNEIKSKNSAKGREHVKYLSDRVKFIPRLDHKTIEAAIAARFNKQKQPHDKLKAFDEAQYSLLKNILNQVLEINQLAQENRGLDNDKTVVGPTEVVIPQVMIAMADGPKDVSTLIAELDDLRREKSESTAVEEQFNYAAEISFVPLFESEETVDPDKITGYLEKMWDYFSKYKGGDGQKEFEKHINEVFIAGSDLSREVGQTSALVRTWETAIAVHEFNKKYTTNVRVKWGTGEAAFRQGGLWDPEGYLPMIRGRVLDHRPLSDVEAEALWGKDWEAQREAENKAVEEARAFLQEAVGDDWQKKLLRNPRGFNRLLRVLKWVNSFTNQSRSKELTLVGINTERLRRMRQEAVEQHDRNVQALKEGGLPLVPEALKAAAQNEQAFYQTMFGKKGEGNTKTKFGGLLEFFAGHMGAPQLRDRANARETPALEKLFADLRKPYVNVRAISANSTSNFLFPLYLVGKGSMLESAAQAGTLNDVMGNQQIDAKELLRHMKIYGTIADDIFGMLRAHGMGDDADWLEEEWKKLVRLRPLIQEEMWRQESPEGVNFADLDPEKKQKFATLTVPGMRELLDDTFTSDRTKLFQENFGRNKVMLDAVVAYVGAGYNYTAADDKEAAFAALEEAKLKVDAITPEAYGSFLANVVTTYSPGM